MSASGMTYAPAPKPAPVVAPGEFPFAVMHLDHGHIFGMTEGLIGAGGTPTWVYDPDPQRARAFADRYPGMTVARSEAEILDDVSVRLVAAAGITNERCAIGLRVIESGKDYFTDKAPLTSLEQLAAAREATARTGLKYAVYYSERIHVEAAVMAGQLIEQGAIGRVLQFIGLGPHRIGDPASRPDWFWEKERYGGILTDIGSHNMEQLLYYTGASDAEVISSTIANYNHPEHPELDDFGDAHLVTDTGATGYCRVDWFTPPGLSTWGDGRTFLLGTEGYIELRKYANIATGEGPGHVFWVNGDGEHHLIAEGQTGFPYFGQLICDCLERTETAMTQEHAFKAAELAVKAQLAARELTPQPGR